MDLNSKFNKPFDLIVFFLELGSKFRLEGSEVAFGMKAYRLAITDLEYRTTKILIGPMYVINTTDE